MLRLLTLLFVLAVGQSALALGVHADGATVVVNGMPVVTLRTTVGNLPPSARAQVMASSLDRAGQGPVTVKRSGKNFLVMVGDHLVLTVTPQEAAASQTTPAGLAAACAHRIRQAVTMVAIQVSASYVRIPEGENRSVGIKGSGEAGAVAESGDEKVAQVQKAQGKLVIKGVGIGKTDVLVTAGGVVKMISVRVMPYAASFPQTMAASVTGLPAKGETVAGAVQTAVRSQLNVTEGAEFSFKAPQAGDLQPGEARTFTVPVTVSGLDMIPAEGSVKVTVRNLGLTKVPEAQLWYCNEPENLRSAGLLFAAPLRPEGAARLLYHHINEMAYPLIVKVEAVNNSDQPARLLLIPGDSQPDKNPVLAGIQAANQFMRHWVINSGEVITVPPHCSLPISMRRIAHGQTVSGLCYLRLLEGGPDELMIRADAKPPFSADKTWAAALASSTPWRYIGPQRVNLVEKDAVIPSLHVYPDPFKEGEMTYSVGGKYGFFRLGERAIKRADNLKSLDGNFGVTYHITANLENTTGQASDVELVFEASAGYTGALLIVNGEMVRTPLLQPKTEAQIMRFHLGAGTSQKVSITTLPLSGSSYPATLTLRPVGLH